MRTGPENTKRFLKFLFYEPLHFAAPHETASLPDVKISGLPARGLL